MTFLKETCKYLRWAGWVLLVRCLGCVYWQQAATMTHDAFTDKKWEVEFFCGYTLVKSLIYDNKKLNFLWSDPRWYHLHNLGKNRIVFE